MLSRMLDDLKNEPMDSSEAFELYHAPDDDKTALLNSEYSDETEAESLAASKPETDFAKLLHSAKPGAPAGPLEIEKAHFSPLPSQSSSEQKNDLKQDDQTLIANFRQSFQPDQPEAEKIDGTPALEAELKASPQLVPKVAHGGGRAAGSPFENPFIQAESLKLAQQRILQLEREVENLRKENEILSSAGDLAKQKNEDLRHKLQNLEKQKHELKEINESELEIFKGGLDAKDSEIRRLKTKIEELENRLANDLRRIRVRERELENRLELSKSEKLTLIRAKDEVILDLKRRSDQTQSDIEIYQNKLMQLQQLLDLNQEQFARTVRALRIALTNLEVNDSTNSAITIAPYKKAE